jgi:hypothetical protein
VVIVAVATLGFVLRYNAEAEAGRFSGIIRADRLECHRSETNEVGWLKPFVLRSEPLRVLSYFVRRAEAIAPVRKDHAYVAFGHLCLIIAR